MTERSVDKALQQAAEWLGQAEALLITAGAGMGVDSGLPDFRGNEGFWNAYPPYRRLGLSFIEAANPRHFRQDPAFGWGFYGHRLELYRRTVPHQGFQQLLEWGKTKGRPSFVVTSNVDGQFQKAGFSNAQLLEIHGSIHHLQCQNGCNNKIWENTESVSVDLTTMKAAEWPRCPYCQTAARPNILMFGDDGWLSHRTMAQEDRFRQFLDQTGQRNLVVLEIGAGTTVPSIRHLSESLHDPPAVRLIRVNPRQHESPPTALGLPYAAAEGLNRLL